MPPILQKFPGSSTVEHSAVNRRVASSNLARGATSFDPLDPKTYCRSLALIKKLHDTSGASRFSSARAKTRAQLAPRGADVRETVACLRCAARRTISPEFGDVES